MTILRAVRVKDYRSFIQAELTVRPLTLLYGDNNVGKSALLRLLPVIYDSCLPGVPNGLNLDSAALRGASLEAIRAHASLAPEGVLKIELVLKTPGGELVASYGFTTMGEQTPARISSLKLSMSPHPHVTLRWAPGDGALEQEQYLFFVQGHEPVTLSQRFEGLRPVDPSVDAPALVHELSSMLRELQRHERSQCLWLSARRPSAPREIERQGLKPLTLDPQGLNAAQFLADDDDLRREVSRWYEAELKQVLEIEPRRADRSVFSLALQSTQDAARRMLMCDSGEGLSQLLPVLTGLEMLRRRDRFGLDVMAVEEPESNLHVLRHEALIEAFVRTIKHESAPTLILETHSRQLLLSVLLHVARGELSKDDVAIHWISMREDGSSQAKLAQVHEDGSLSRWPASAFSSEPELEQRLARAQDDAYADQE